MTVFRVFPRYFITFMALAGLLILAACSSGTEMRPGAPAARLGTAWGEDVQSRSSSVALDRLHRDPQVSILSYSAAPGNGQQIRELPMAGGDIGLRVIDENGHAWPIHRDGSSAHLQGRQDAQYILEYRNRSKSTYEIVVTVDGLDVVNGKPGSYKNRGYVLRGGEMLRIKGFRKSRDEVAAFRFSSVPDSYAANSDAGSVANVGVIGTALFALRDLDRAAGLRNCADGPCAFPASQTKNQRDYAPAPN